MRGVHPPGDLPLVRADHLLLAQRVHLDVFCVQVDGHPPGKDPGPLTDRQRGQRPARDLGRGPLNALAPGLVEPGRQRGSRGGRRHRRRQQPLTHHIRTQSVEADQMVLASQLHRRHSQRELPAGQAPVALLDRPDLRVQGRGDAQRPVQLGHHHQAAVLRQRLVRRTEAGPQPIPPLPRGPRRGTTTRYRFHLAGALSCLSRLGVGTSIFSNWKRTCRRISC